MSREINIKRFYPWIPIVGIPLTVISDPDDTGLSNPNIHMASALYQAVSFGLCLAFIII